MRRFLLPVVLLALLAVALWIGSAMPATPTADSGALVDAVMDKLGVTRQDALIAWLETDDQTTVWIARGGKVHYHNNPLCGGMKAPVAHSLADAEAMGYIPCPDCPETADQPLE